MSAYDKLQQQLKLPAARELLAATRYLRVHRAKILLLALLN
jgi:hypothetical protein